jgi:hypothetical protein
VKAVEKLEEKNLGEPTPGAETAKEVLGWKKTLAWLVNSKALYAVLFCMFILYITTKSPLFAILIAFSIISIFVAETVESAGKTGWVNEVKEIAIAIGVAALIWYGSGFILGTGAPLDAVTSCSMLPSLERGDMVILSGGEPNAPEVSISQEEFSNWKYRDEQVVCAMCEKMVNGFKTLVPCAANVERSGVGLKVTGEANQSGNLLQFECGTCMKKFSNGKTETVPCTKSVSLKGRNFSKDLSNDIIVYTPLEGDLFRAEIIHRAVFKMDVEGKKYFFTWGDNNDQMDIQFGNSPIPSEKIVGKSVVRLPYIGYVKLFLFGYFSTPAGCDSVLGQ